MTEQGLQLFHGPNLGQARGLHSLRSINGALQGLSEFLPPGIPQVLVLDCWPPPHVTLHSVQSVQGPKSTDVTYH